MIYDEKFFRNPLSGKQQEKIRQTVFAIVGLGGTGGFILENLLRAGAENFILFDHDRFELSNFNRQILATDDVLDKLKTRAAVARARSINRSAKIRAFKKFNSGLGNAHILLDGSDNVRTKLAMAKAARRKKIPYVFCSAGSSKGIVTVFTGYRFEKAFQIDERLDYSRCQTIICAAASIAGSIAATEAINYILKKPYVRAPEALFFDLFKKEMFWRAELG